MTTSALKRCCSVDTLVARNTIRNMYMGLRVEGNWYGCDQRLQDNTTIDSNLFVIDEHWGAPAARAFAHIELHSGHASPLNKRTGDVTVTNNVLVAEPADRADFGIHIEIGNDVEPQDSEVIIAGNTIVGTYEEAMAVRLDGHPEVVQQVTYLNNIQAESANNWTVWYETLPATVVSDGNTFSSTQFDWDNVTMTFGAYKAASGLDGASLICPPQFGAAQTRPLAPGDVCARGAGVPRPGILPLSNVDGDARDVDAPVAGANADPGQIEVVFSDEFLALDDPRVGRGWVAKGESGPWAFSRARRGLAHSGGGAGGPLAVARPFAEQAGGTLVWRFVGELEASAGDEDGWYVAVQLGDASSMQGADADAGVAVDLRWGSAGAGFASPGNWGVVEASRLTDLGACSRR